MKKTTTLSTVISADVKKAATEYCKKHGLKLQYMIEKGLVDQLEDWIDLEAYRERKSEPTIPFEEVLKGIGKRK